MLGNEFLPSASIAYEIRRTYGIDFRDADLDVNMRNGHVYVGSYYCGTWDAGSMTLTLDRAPGKHGPRRVQIRVDHDEFGEAR